jgi:DNA-binding transcriptional ArsR family regulator
MSDQKQPDLNIDVEIDRLVHEPVRLKILAYLSEVESADFVFLVSRLGLTMGNLSAHISKLQEAGYIEIDKSFKGNRPHTLISLTLPGAEAFSKYRDGMLQLLQ